MTDMLEQIARAARKYMESVNPDEHTADELSLGVARAALMAMREPTDGVLWSDPALLDNAHLFTAMIDAILKEGGE